MGGFYIGKKVHKQNGCVHALILTLGTDRVITCVIAMRGIRVVWQAWFADTQIVFHKALYMSESTFLKSIPKFTCSKRRAGSGGGGGFFSQHGQSILVRLEFGEVLVCCSTQNNFVAINKAQHGQVIMYCPSLDMNEYAANPKYGQHMSQRSQICEGGMRNVYKKLLQDFEQLLWVCFDI